MKKGWIVYNGYLNNKMIPQPVKWLYEKASEAEMEIELKKNSELHTVYESDKIALIGFKKQDLPDFVIFWDKDICLATTLEKLGVTLYNSARAIEICDDKALTFQVLAGNGIQMPKTIVAPKTFEKIGYNDTTYLDHILEELEFPFIIKECYGSLGEQVYMANNKKEMKAILRKLGTKPHIFQEFVKSSKGRDVRIQVVGGKMIAAMYRYNDCDFRSNVALGGKTQSYLPTKEMAELALKICKIIGLDFAGVDFLIGEKNEPILCEVNSNPNMQGLYESTGVNTAQHIIEYVKKQAK